MARSTKIASGTRFRYPIHEDLPVWEVCKALRGSNYRCVVVDDEDYAGRTMILHLSIIQEQLRIEAVGKAIMQASTDFYASLKPGEVVHYHNGFGEFVRCEVVVHEGENHLKPLALVGIWKFLRADGYYPRKIREGELFHPHASNLYENPSASVPRTVNPADLPTLTLEV